VLLILLIGLSVCLTAQPNRQRINPISEQNFQQLISSLNSINDDAQKLVIAKRSASVNRLTSEQVKRISETFVYDFGRLEFAKSAWENTTDQENFYDVYNTFLYFSNVFKLHDFVLEKKSGSKEVINPPVQVMTFPEMEYPDFRRYFGQIGCTNVLPDPNFMSLAERVFNETSEDRKLALANNISFSNCLQTAQAMKLASLLQNEASRLDFLKKARPKVFDPDNYRFALPLFKSENFRREFNLFIGSGGGVGEIKTENPPCEVSPKDLMDLKALIKKQSFENTKLNIAQQSIKGLKCFKTEQIIELLTLFSFSDSKLIMAKFAYDYTSDKANYVKIADSLAFTRDKDDFLKFLKSKQ
jgi:hypothetical protein